MSALAVCLLWSAVVAADPPRAHMAEPVLADTVTDIDGDSAGDVESDLVVTLPRSHGVAWETGTLGVEGRITRRLGIEIEAGLDGARNYGAQGELTLRAAYSLVHDKADDFHVQLEASASRDRTFGSHPAGMLPSTDGAPDHLGVRVGYRYQRLTLRAGAGAALPNAGTAPVWADLAAYAEFGPRRGDTSFVGVEAVTDWTSETPVVVVPEIALAFFAGGDVTVAVGVPVFMGNHETGVYAGGLAAMIVEFAD